MILANLLQLLRTGVFHVLIQWNRNNCNPYGIHLSLNSWGQKTQEQWNGLIYTIEDYINLWKDCGRLFFVGISFGEDHQRSMSSQMSLSIQWAASYLKDSIAIDDSAILTPEINQHVTLLVKIKVYLGMWLKQEKLGRISKHTLVFKSLESSRNVQNDFIQHCNIN